MGGRRVGSVRKADAVRVSVGSTDRFHRFRRRRSNAGDSPYGTSVGGDRVPDDFRHSGDGSTALDWDGNNLDDL